MNDYFNGNLHGRGFNAMYYWEQFQPILAAVAILLVGWVIALLVAGGIKKVLQKLGTDQKLSNATGHRSNIELIVSRVVFWVILIIAVIGALNVLNLTSVSGPFSSMIQQFLLFIPQLLAAAGVLNGRSCSAYPACAPEVRLSGGHYAAIGIDQAHVDGNLVTAPAWPAHPQWLAKFNALLE